MADRTSTDARSSRPGGWDLLPGYALEALDAPDRLAVERLLEADADARRSLDEYREVVAAFAVDTDPPAHVRAGVLERVRTAPQHPAPGARSAPAPAGRAPRAASTWATPGAPESGPSPDGTGDSDVIDLTARRRRRRWGLAIAAVAAAAAIAFPTTIAVQVTAERNQLRERSEIVSEMLADPDASIRRATVEGGGEASMLVAEGDMFFRADGLPEPERGRAYQLWIVQADGSISSAGVLPWLDGEASSLVLGSDGVGLAVSVEPESGSEQPTGDPVVVLGT